MMMIHRQAEVHHGLKRTTGDPNIPDIRDIRVGVQEVPGCMKRWMKMKALLT